jgi:DNA-binding LacI/PurR family transcriptional regulator
MSVGRKYREIEHSLRSDIARGVWRPGDRIPAERILSERFGVAHMTVRQAVGALVSEGLLRRVNGIGTFVGPHGADASPKDGLASGLVLMVPRALYTVPPDPLYFADILASFTAELEQAGYCMTFRDFGAAEQEEQFPPGTVLACLLTTLEETELTEQLHSRGYPVLAINRYKGRRSIASIMPDNAGGVEHAVDHLTVLGHRRIGFLAGPTINLDALERRAGFRSAMRRHGLSPTLEAGYGFHEAAGYEGARQLLTRAAPPTAIVCASDLSAVGVLKAAGELGRRVPYDLSVIGFGDFPLGIYITPELTTVRLPRPELGRAAAQALLTLRRGERVFDEVLPTCLIERGTSGPPTHS